MECPYCNQMSFKEQCEYPYPYRKEYKNNKGELLVVQLIYKYQCSCGYPFFVEVKSGFPTQIYKQGMYQYHG